MPESLHVIWETPASLMAVTAERAYTRWGNIQARRPDTGDVIWEAPELDPGYAVDIAVVAATEDRLVMRSAQVYGYGPGSEPAPPSLRELSVSTGEQLWALPAVPFATAALLGDVLVGVGQDGELLGISPDGTLAWTRRDGVVSEVVPTDGTGAAFAPSPDRLILVGSDGTFRWERVLDAEPFRQVRYSGDGLVIAGRTLDAYDMNGEHVAQYRSDDPDPVGVVQGDVCMILASDELLAVRGDRALWRTPVPGTDVRRGSVCHDVRVGPDICLATTDRGVFAVVPDNGRMLWAWEFPKGADVVEMDGDFVLTNGLGGFRVHDRASGVVVASWLIDDPQAGVHRPLALGNGRMLVSLANGDTKVVVLAR